MTVEERKTRQRIYNKRYREKHLEKQREYYREYARQYRKDHPEYRKREQVRRNRWARDHYNREKNTVRCRKLSLKRLYGLSPKTYSDMSEAQKGCCAICGDLSPKLKVDHCHETGQVRALLCNLCNSAIGFLRDDAAIVRRALEYLEKFSEGVPNA